MDPVTIFGIAALTFMLVTYALEHRGPRFVIAFAIACALSSAYGFLSGAWPFGVVEIVWAGVAIRRFRGIPRSRASTLWDRSATARGRPMPAPQRSAPGPFAAH